MPRRGAGDRRQRAGRAGRHPRLLALILLAALAFAGAATAAEHRFAPGELQAGWTRVQPGDRVVLAPGDHPAARLLVPEGVAVVAEEPGTAVLRPRNGESPLLRVEGAASLAGVVLEGREGPAIELAAGSALLLDDCVLRGWRGAAAIAGSPARLEMRGGSFEAMRDAIRLEWPDGDGGDVVVDGAGFALAGDGAGVVLVRPGAVDFASTVRGGAEGLRVLDASGAVRLDGARFEGQATRGALVRDAAGPVAIRGTELGGRFGTAGLQVVLADGGTVAVDGLRTSDDGASAGGLGLATFASLGAVASFEARDVRLEGDGGIGLMLRWARAESAVLEGARFDGFLAAVDYAAAEGAAVEGAAAEGGGALVWRAGGDAPGGAAGGADGVRLRGRGTELRIEGPVAFEDLWRGVAAEHGARIAAHGAVFQRIGAAALAVESGASASARGARFEECALAVHASPSAGAVDLGTEEDPGANRFHLARSNANPAIRNESAAAAAARGNAWLLDGEEVFSSAAIGALVDGAADLPRDTRFPGGAIVWNPDATRRTEGFGRTVFADAEEVAERLGAADELVLAEGAFPASVALAAGIPVRGAGAGRTIVRMDAPGPFAAAGTPRLAALSIDGAGTEGPLFDPEASGAELRGVAIAGFAGAPLRFMAGDGAIVLEDLEVESQGPDGAIIVEGRAARLSNARVRHEGGGAAVALRGGEAVVEGLAVDGAMETALAVDAGGSAASLSDLDLRGFTGQGLLLGGGPGAIAVDRATIRGSGAATGIASWTGGAVELRRVDIDGPAVGLAVAGGPERVAVDGLRARAEGGAAGVRIALAGQRTEAFRLDALDIEGFDAGLLLDAAHSSPVGIVVGGGSRFAACGTGVVAASPRGRLHLEGVVASGNGTGLLAEGGETSAAASRLHGNEAGVVVRAGLVDLGGGYFDSAGGNTLWPQSGGIAIANEGRADVWALGNEWGEAAALLDGPGRPFRDRARNDRAGAVLTRLFPPDPGPPPPDGADPPEGGVSPPPDGGDPPQDEAPAPSGP